MSMNQKMITTLMKSSDKHKFRENMNWKKFENYEIYEDILYFEYKTLPILVTWSV
jgi:hypothetical protein